ncbi:MFS transporter [Falsarthrobacter nasiphocae]|uniref:MFS family permease n=1 Tax=Falsarthrobacter nasiphocae TaxID=189863 RepID=A0AAE3YIG8_9MICC|nr:MFS transporter [Falsarthrobacter nasiphocae]MDR6892805.1 MFS family permease [Falsarthrobacter nasiphocae]
MTAPAGKIDSAESPFAAFRTLFAAASRPFLLGSALGRIPQAMMAVGTLTYIPSVGGSYALAGLASASVGIGSAVGAPLFGRLVDRRGPRGVLLVFAIIQAVAFLAYLLSAPVLVHAQTAWAQTLLLLHSAVIGAACPQIGAVARVVWRKTFGSGSRMGTAMSYESTVDELSFVVGPVLVGALATVVTPAAPMIVSALWVLASVIVLVRSLPRTGTQTESAGPARLTGWVMTQIVLCTLGMISMGTIFGGTLTALLPFTHEHGLPDGAGLLYGALSLTSAIVAVSMPFWAPRVPKEARWAGAGALLVVFALIAYGATSIGGMLVALLLMGLPVGATMVTIFETAGEETPAGVLATVMTVLGSGIVLGTSLSSAAAGALADEAGSGAAFGVAVAGAAGILITGAVQAALHWAHARRATGGNER